MEKTLFQRWYLIFKYNAEGSHKTTYYLSYIIIKDLKFLFLILYNDLCCSKQKLNVWNEKQK